MKLRKKPTPEEEAAFIGGAKADKAEVGETPAPEKTPPPPAPAEETVVPTPTVQKIKLKAELVDPHQYVRRTEWPILPSLDPAMAEGREDLDKPFVMRMKENLWCSIDRHCKALGVDKSKWIRQAMLNQLAAEQQHFVKLSKKA